MQSLSAFQQCSLFPRHFIRIALFKVSCGLERMSIQTLVKTVLIVAAIMPCLSQNTTNLTAVRDTDGEALIAGSPYYVLPVIPNFGGGLTLKKPNWSNQSYVAQGLEEDSEGIPVIFTPLSENETEIYVNRDLQVESVPLNTWQIDSSVDPERALVATGGTPSTFRIHAYAADYVLVFCEVPCRLCEPVCSKLGIHVDSNSDRWLASPSDAAIPIFFPFSFKNATVADSDSGAGFQSE